MRWVAEAVAGALREAGFTEVFTARPAAWAHPEPVVVACTGFERISRQDGEERGEAAVEVRVVRGSPDAADRDAAEAERALRAADRAALSCAEGRVVGIDTRPPEDEGEDGSGRAVASVACTVTIARRI